MSRFAQNHPELAAEFRFAVGVGTLLGAWFAASATAIATIATIGQAHIVVGASCAVLGAIGSGMVVGVGGILLDETLKP